MAPSPGLTDSHGGMSQEEYSSSMKAELENIRERVRALEGDSVVEQAWEEVTGAWGRLQLATEDQWEDAKGEFESSWKALQQAIDDAG